MLRISAVVDLVAHSRLHALKHISDRQLGLLQKRKQHESDLVNRQADVLT